MTAEQRFNAWQKRHGEIDPHRIRDVRIRDDNVLVVIGRSGYRYPVSEDDAALARTARRIITSKEFELRTNPPRTAAQQI